jgi:prefoldin subunit 5
MIEIERIERAKRTVARQMVNLDMPHLIETIEFLDAELDKLRQRKAAMDRAREILQNGSNIGSNIIEAR